MPPPRRIVPSVLLILLSALGFLMGLLVAVSLFFLVPHSAGFLPSSLSDLALSSAANLSLLIALLNLPTLVLAVRYLRGLDRPVRLQSPLRLPLYLGLLWLLMLKIGSRVVQTASLWPLLAPLSVLAIALPAWLLVELGRKGLPRSSALREWGTLTVGLTAAPLLIILLEVMLVVILILVVVVTLGFNTSLIEQLTTLPQILDQSQQDVQALDELLSLLLSEPLITAAVFLMVSVIAPLIEELLKPLAVWLLLKRPLTEHEGFTLGLISGGAFALLESASLIGQIDPASWLPAVALRSATAVLHIGLSGMLGYGMTYAWNHKRVGIAMRYLFGAVGLHGMWNAMALIGGFSSIAAEAFKINLGDILPLLLMSLIFMAVVLIVSRINHSLRMQVAQPVVKA